MQQFLKRATGVAWAGIVVLPLFREFPYSEKNL